ncbi:MAG TPA: XRE family transcriptional regulator [Candidatus Acetothermia bacterium]|nr:XRE family transcriptional regulator [Candidatus Acetothermia bacterium]
MLYYSVRMAKSIEGQGLTVASWVQKVRTKLGFSQYELAQILGVHWVTVSRWETGRSQPRLSQLQALAKLYLDRALDIPHLIATTPPTPVRVFSHGVAYDLPGVLPQVGRYLMDGLRLGYLVVFLKESTSSPEQILEGLSLSPELSQHPALKILDGEDFYFERGQFSLAQLVWEERKLRKKALEDGFRRLRIIGDLRPVLRRGVPSCQLVAMEYVVNGNFHSQKDVHGISIFPAQLPDPSLATCILCRHPWIIGPAGPVRNPYYDDPVLCQARRYLGGETRGGIGSR